MSDRPLAIGIDVGGTKVLGGLVSDEGEVSEIRREPTPRAGGVELLELVARLAEELAMAAGAPGIRAVGVGTAGVVVADRVVSANALLPGWAQQPLAARLDRALGAPVAVVNDVHAAALAEARFGAARGARAALVVAVGTGIGGALLRDGVVDPGPRGLAGSIGHIPAALAGDRVCACGAIGHLEAYASGRSIELSYREAGGAELPLTEIARHARGGDRRAAAAIGDAARLLGRALGGASNLLDVDLLVLAGGVAEIGPLFLDPLRAGVEAERMSAAPMPPVETATMGGTAAVTGAALAALAAAGIREGAADGE